MLLTMLPKKKHQKKMHQKVTLSMQVIVEMSSTRERKIQQMKMLKNLPVVKQTMLKKMLKMQEMQ